LKNQYFTFRADQSYPAFFNHRLYPGIGKDPGDGTRGTGVGDDWDSFGGYHEWEVSSIVDTRATWEVTALLINNAPFPNDNCPDASLTSDLAIRKPQQFKPRSRDAGEWRNGGGKTCRDVCAARANHWTLFLQTHRGEIFANSQSGFDNRKKLFVSGCCESSGSNSNDLNPDDSAHPDTTIKSLLFLHRFNFKVYCCKNIFPVSFRWPNSS
jgi:hypothetical protein